MLLLATTYRPPWPRAAVVLAAVLLVAALTLWGGRSGRMPRAGDAADPAWHAEVEWRHRAYQARLARRRALGRAVAEGRMALVEAAARFAAVDRLPPEVRADLARRQYPGASDEERYCRDVISWAVRELAPDDPCEAVALRGRLEAELERRLRDGLRLPAVEESPLTP